LLGELVFSKAQIMSKEHSLAAAEKTGKVYVIYSRKDIDFANRLVASLEARGDRGAHRSA